MHHYSKSDRHSLQYIYEHDWYELWSKQIIRNCKRNLCSFQLDFILSLCASIWCLQWPVSVSRHGKEINSTILQSDHPAKTASCSSNIQLLVGTAYTPDSPDVGHQRRSEEKWVIRRSRRWWWWWWLVSDCEVVFTSWAAFTGISKQIIDSKAATVCIQASTGHLAGREEGISWTDETWWRLAAVFFFLLLFITQR